MVGIVFAPVAAIVGRSRMLDLEVFDALPSVARVTSTDLECDACHSVPDFSVSMVSCAEYELATLLYLYGLREKVIAHITTSDYQRKVAKSEALVLD